MKRRYLYRPPPANHPALRNVFPARLGTAAPAPASWDLRRWLLPPRDQGEEGCCSGFGTAALRECSRAVATGLVTAYLSPAYLYWRTRLLEGSFPQDAGATIADELTTLKNYGVCPEVDLVYNSQAGEAGTPQDDVQALPFRCGLPLAVDFSNPENFETALANNAAVVFGMPVYQSFEDTGADGLVAIPAAAEQCLGGHCMLAVGYNRTAGRLTVRNSWGTDWGESGYCYLPYGMIPSFCEAWVIPVQP